VSQANTLIRFRSIFLRYGLALLLAVSAAGMAWLIKSIIGGTTAPLFYAAVILSAWWGGLGPGLLATALDGYFCGLYMLNPVGSPGFGYDDTLQLIMFLMVALLISSLTSLRKRAEAALQQSYDQLELRIDQRTHELRRSNDLLRESEERFRLLVEGVADYAMVMLDSQGRIVSWNQGAERIFGFTHEQAVGRDISTFYADNEIAKAKPAADLLDAASLGRQEDEGWRVRRDGGRFWANVITTALRDEQGNPRGFAQVTRDVTELRRLEKELLEISEREQLRIGHDLHDGIGQELTGIALLAQNLQQKLAQNNLSESGDAARIASLINRTLAETRRLAHGFAPIELGPAGLHTALADLAAKVQFSLAGKCAVTCRGEAHVQDDAVAVHLFRIAQEAVNNAVRHASPSEIRIELEIMSGMLTLGVHDNGPGMAPAGGRGKGMGIGVMRYRARIIGAALEIRSGNFGTSVICGCPLPQTNESNDARTQEVVPPAYRGAALSRAVGG
jgi:PAS domain S-box-containing protein